MSALPTTDKFVRGRAHVSKVLVAEDHEDTRFLLRLMLELRGLAVVEAADGVEAVDAAEREHPDLIFMDGEMPRLDGVAATRRLRGLASFSGVPIVFLSGHAGPREQAEARAAGCDDYVVKPFDFARLEGVLDRLLPARWGRDDMGVNDSMTQAGFGRECKNRAGCDGGPSQKLFGLVELDPAGTVLYNNFEQGGAGALDLTGLNFYSEVTPFRNVGEFRQRLDTFSRGSLPAQSFDFTCDYEDGPLAVRLLLTRIREGAGAETTGSVLVHIKRAP